MPQGSKGTLEDIQKIQPVVLCILLFVPRLSTSGYDSRQHLPNLKYRNDNTVATGNSIGCTFRGHILGGHERLYNNSDIEIVTTQGRFDSMHGNKLCLWLIKTKHQHDTVN